MVSPLQLAGHYLAWFSTLDHSWVLTFYQMRQSNLNVLIEGYFAIGGHSHGCWNPHCSLISLGTWQFKSFSSWSYALISLSSEQNLVTRYFSVGLNFVNLSEQHRIQYFCLHMCSGRKNHHGVMQGSLVSSKGGKNESWKGIGWINYKLLTGI